MKKVFVLLSFMMPSLASAHVRYIATDADVLEFGGRDWNSFLSPLFQIENFGLIITTIVVVAVVTWVLMRSKAFHTWSHRIVKVAASYKSFVPLIARFALGVGLIGSSLSHVLLSPVLPGTEILSTIQLVLGFFLLFGFLVGPSAIATLILFAIGISTDIYMIGAFDTLALIAVLLVLDDRRPGIDEILGIPDFTKIKSLKKYVPTIVRLGLGIAMAYLAIVEKVLNPHLTEFVVEVTKLTDVIPVSEAMWVFSAGAIELALGLLLIVGLLSRLVSAITFVVLALSFFYFGEEVWSHVTLFGAVVAVFILGSGPLSLDSWIERRKHWWKF